MYNQRGQSTEGPMPKSPSINLTKKAGGMLYKNPLDCLIQTVRAEGILAVYKVRCSDHSLTVGIFCTSVADCPSYYIVRFLVFKNGTDIRTLTFMEQVIV
jgi:hypothetical protein